MDPKQALRRTMREARRDCVTALPDQLRGLIFNRPPQEIADYLADCDIVGLYHATAFEAPSLGWARWLHEQGKQLALPRVETDSEAMQFRIWRNPWDEDELEPGPHGLLQPPASADPVTPQALVVPLLAFDENGARLGQGGGYYDRWIAQHAPVKTIGLAWDVQKTDRIPLDPHDQPLDAIVTPTRLYWSHS